MKGPNIVKKIKAKVAEAEMNGAGRTGETPVLLCLAPAVIMRSKTNPRKTFPAASQKELEESVRTHGVIEPLIVREVKPRAVLREPDLTAPLTWTVVGGKDADTGEQEQKSFNSESGARAFLAEVQPEITHPYELVAGERRWRAATAVKAATVPCIVRTLSDDEARTLQQVENLQREDLSEIEEGEGYRALLDAGWTLAQLMEKLHKGRTHIFEMMALAKMSPVAREALTEGKIPRSVAMLVARVPGTKLQEQALKKILEGKDFDYKFEVGQGEIGWGDGQTPKVPLSYRQARALIFKEFLLDLKKATWDLADRTFTEKSLGKASGLPNGLPPCTECPKRSGNCPELYPDIKSPDVCTDRACWHQKREQFEEGAVLDLRSQGHAVLSTKEAAKVYGTYGLKSDTGFVEPKGWVAYGKKNVHWSDLVERLHTKERPKPVFALIEGEQKKLYAEESLRAALEAGGIKLDEPEKATRQMTPEERKAEEAKQGLEREFQDRFGEEVRRRVVEGAKKLKEREFFELLFEELQDHAHQERVTEGEIGKDRVGNVVVIVDLLQAAAWNLASLKEITAACGVDVKQVEKELRAALAAGQKPAPVQKAMKLKKKK